MDNKREARPLAKHLVPQPPVSRPRHLLHQLVLHHHLLLVLLPHRLPLVAPLAQVAMDRYACVEHYGPAVADLSQVPPPPGL